MQPKRVLIAGCGYVGTELALQLATAGHGVWALRRRAQLAPAELRAICADLTDPATLSGLPAALDAVVYAAAPSTGYDETAYRNTYLQGLKNLMGALSAQGQAGARLIFVSSTGVYGQTAGEWVDEQSETEPSGFSGRCMLEAEAAALGGPFPATVVRFGGIYGPGRTRLIDAVCSGSARRQGRGTYTNRIHRDDCAGVLVHLLEAERPAPIYIGVDREPALRDEVLSWIAAKLGLPPPPMRGDEQPPHLQRGGNKRCSSQRLIESGYAFRYPTYREGYGALLGPRV